MTETIRIVLADDHALVRQGLRALLEAEPGFTIVGEAADGPEALSVVRRLRPDVLVVDVVMPGLGGLEVARRVRRLSERTRIVMLSMYSNEAYVAEALRNGAAAYVLKCSSVVELVRAIREVMAGQHYLSPPLSEEAVEEYVQRVRDSARDPYETLTAREREVCHLAVRGLSNPQVAARLHVSTRTVESHRASLLGKLGLRGQTDLVRFAMRSGLLPTDE